MRKVSNIGKLGKVRKLRTLARQRGVAVITALLLTTLAVTIVASLFWQQQVQVRSMENQRLHLQTKWILRGALELSTLVLKSRFGDENRYTAMNQVWATPLAETRLDQYIERDRVQGEVFDATLSGAMQDATARYNLTNLSSGPGTMDKQQVDIFARLLSLLRIDPALAQKAARAVADADTGPLPGALAGGGNPPASATPNPDGTPAAAATPNPDGTPAGAATPPTPQAGGAAPARGNTPVRLTQVDDLLAVPGYTKEIVDKLRQFVIVLPEPTPININTAPAEVIAAHVQNWSVGRGNALAEQVKRIPIIDEAMIALALHESKLMEGAKVGIKSNYFLVQSRIRLDRAALDAESLVKVDQSNQATVLSVRQN
jgi:general secretion pathway protein K